MEKIRISHPHHRLNLPRTVICCAFTPQNLHRWDIYGAELTSLSTHYRYWILSIGQIVAKLNCLRLRYMQRIRDTFSTSTRGKLDEYAITLAVTPIYTLLHPLSIESRTVPIYIGASFSFLSNFITLFIGDTFRNTKSPAENDTSFLLRFA